MEDSNLNFNPPSLHYSIPWAWNYWRSYSPLPTRFNTVNPAFFALEIETRVGELNVDRTLRTGFLQAGQCVSGLADNGRFKVNLPPHTLQSPSQSSYS